MESRRLHRARMGGGERLEERHHAVEIPLRQPRTTGGDPLRLTADLISSLTECAGRGLTAIRFSQRGQLFGHHRITRMLGEIALQQRTQLRGRATPCERETVEAIQKIQLRMAAAQLPQLRTTLFNRPLLEIQVGKDGAPPPDRRRPAPG